MSNHSIIFIGLDTHKESTEVAYSLNNRRSPIQSVGRVKTSKQEQLQDTHISKQKVTIQHKFPNHPSVSE